MHTCPKILFYCTYNAVDLLSKDDKQIGAYFNKRLVLLATLIVCQKKKRDRITNAS